MSKPHQIPVFFFAFVYFPLPAGDPWLSFQAASSIDRRPQSGFFAPTELARVSSSFNTQAHMNEAKGYGARRATAFLPQADAILNGLDSLFTCLYF